MAALVRLRIEAACASPRRYALKKLVKCWITLSGTSS